jgi:sucrose-6-phosphate hydrolase SacC (GH32 family)
MSARAAPWRPRLHFTPASNWINDPNGLIVHDGEVHLFYQYNPFGDQWGHMSWGHAVSRDFIDWQELPVAIPEDERVSIFSGSVVIDAHDSAGFGAGAWVAAYTGCLRRNEGGQAQELAFSLDRGRTWTKYEHNPVLDLGLRDFRDPKVFWHEATSRWVMVVVLPDDRSTVFYTSRDLKQWQEASRFAAPHPGHGIWECPDLIRVPRADGVGTVWMLKVDVIEGHPSGGSGARIFFGDFDGTRFTPEAEDAPRWADRGADFYAALSWAGLADRAVWVAWMNCHRYAKHLPTSPWRGAMSLPRELTCRRGADGRWLLCQQPVRELRAWCREAIELGSVALDAGARRGLLPARLDGRVLEIEIDGIEAGDWWLDVLARGDEFTRVGYDAQAGVLYVDRSRSGFVPPADAAYVVRREAPCDAPRRVSLWIDTASVEVFAGDGHLVVTEQVFPLRDDSRGVILGATQAARFASVRLRTPGAVSG